MSVQPAMACVPFEPRATNSRARTIARECNQHDREYQPHCVQPWLERVPLVERVTRAAESTNTGACNQANGEYQKAGVCYHANYSHAIMENGK